ncbi:MAG: hypothetical protein KA965_12635, partial [Butyrivibrio sp.]|nr:hypothetical protein [Butyrivibrio sp.]
MADKIRKIDDYRKMKDEKNEKEQVPFSEKTHETDIDDIKIEDPFDFLNPAERAEYMKAHQETLLGVNIDLKEAEKTEKVEAEQEETDSEDEAKAKDSLKNFFSFRRNQNEKKQDADIRDDDFVEDRATEADYDAASRKEQYDSEEEEEPVDKKEKNSPEK